MKNFCFIFICFLTIFIAKATEKKACFGKDDAVSFLKTAADFLSKADSANSICNQDECSGRMANTYIGVARKMILVLKENYTNCVTIKEPDDKDKEPDDKDKEPEDKPNDCADILEGEHKGSGVYSIWPSESGKTGKKLQVYCDMETDFGGWTLIQRRGKFAVQQNFFQKWETYKKGFGNIREEFWLGNENIRVLCYKGCDLRIDLVRRDRTKGYAVYKDFKLSSGNYKLHIGRYAGTAGDNLQYQKNNPFSTKDKGQVSQANMHKGGWWYCASYCYVNLNGPYQPTKNDMTTVHWYSFSSYENLVSVEIKVRP